MDAIKKGRRPYRTQVTKLITDLNALVAANPVDKVTIAVKLELLVEVNKKMADCDDEVLEKMAEDGATDREQDAEMDAIMP